MSAFLIWSYSDYNKSNHLPVVDCYRGKGKIIPTRVWPPCCVRPSLARQKC